MPDRMYDIDLRLLLCRFLATQGGTIKREVSIGDTRADIVRMTDQIEGYEIKGDTDPLHSRRFKTQIVEYTKVFDRCWLVISSNGKPITTALKSIPFDWGLITIDKEATIRRMAARNYLVNPIFLAGQIWKVDWVKYLRSRGHRFTGGVPGKSAVVRLVHQKCSLDEIRAEVIRCWTEQKSTAPTQ